MDKVLNKRYKCLGNKRDMLILTYKINTEITNRLYSSMIKRISGMVSRGKPP